MLSSNSVHNTDACALLSQLDSAALIVTDPPYGVGSQISHKAPKARRFKEIMGAYEINGGWLPEAYRALAKGGTLYMFAKWTNIDVWLPLVRGAGFAIQNVIVWDKLHHGSGDLKGTYSPQYELIVFATKGRHLLRGPRLADVLRVQKIHPTLLKGPYEKPAALLKTLIYKSSEPGALVVDPFCGTGSTALAARDIGRDYVVGDLDPHWASFAAGQLQYGFTLMIPGLEAIG